MTEELRPTDPERLRRDGPRTLAEFLLAVGVLTVLAYMFKGRDRGIPVWQVLAGCLIFGGITLLVRAAVEHRKG